MCRWLSSLLTDRYFAPRFVHRERSKKLQRLKVDRVEGVSEDNRKYIPLNSSSAADEHAVGIRHKLRLPIP